MVIHEQLDTAEEQCNDGQRNVDIWLHVESVKCKKAIPISSWWEEDTLPLPNNSILAFGLSSLWLRPLGLASPRSLIFRSPV